MKILLVEDNRILAKNLIKGLQQKGFSVEYCMRGDEGEEFFFSHYESLDVVILDIMLPMQSGIEICKNIREKGISTPILMLTAKDTNEDTVNGLNTGADDYLPKPFSFEVLVARLNALLRRKAPIQQEIVHITPSVWIDFQKKAVFQNGEEVHLSAKEFAILEVLARNDGVALSRDQIFDKAFDFAADNWSNTIDVHIKNIRKKLFANENEDPIKTIRGVGYRLEITK